MGFSKAWSPVKAENRYFAFARPFAANGGSVVKQEPSHEEAVKALLQELEEDPAPAIDPDADVIVALDSHGEVIGCATIGLISDADGALAGWLGRLVVAPQWRNQGVGTILVGMVPKLFIASTSGVNFANAPSFTIFGSCSTASRSFYNRAGYKVFDPGTPLRLPFGTHAALHNNNAAYPCWFTRTL